MGKNTYYTARGPEFGSSQPSKNWSTVIGACHSNVEGWGLVDSQNSLLSDSGHSVNNRLIERPVSKKKKSGREMEGDA